MLEKSPSLTGMNQALRQLPQVQTLLEYAAIQKLVSSYCQQEVTQAIRCEIDTMRQIIMGGGGFKEADHSPRVFAERIEAHILKARQMNLRPVINATGVIIHTNLGRAPLAPEALRAMHEVAHSYSTLEFDLATGERGSRYSHVEQLICDQTGAEAAIVVNNCAAAVFLTLGAFARGHEVIASRGELIEIGGSFRMPDVIESSGARLVEVGATNKTRLSDYQKAISESAKVVLKSHTSNFRIVGFSDGPSRAELAQVAHDNQLVFVEDLGSGVLVDLSPYGFVDEPIVADVVKAGVDVVMFSGDKLLGGPQAGIIVGKQAIIDQLKREPILRAMRIDKLSLAALEATLRLYLPPNDPFSKVPVLQRISFAAEGLDDRARRLKADIEDIDAIQCEIEPCTAYVGGGSLPQADLPSFAVTVLPKEVSVQEFAQRLRQADPPIIGRIEKAKFWFDMRTVQDSELALIAKAVHGAAS